MARFLVEVPHQADTLACARAVDAFLRSGSHFLTHAEWGCKAGEHKAWIIVELDDKAEVRNIVPAAYRAGARIIGLNHFTLQEIDEILRYHRA